MDKETLSNYGWIVVCIMVLVVMIALATPFGTFIKSGVENTTQGLFDTEQSAFEAVGIDIADQSFDDGSGTTAPDPALNPSGVVPEGATYTKIDGWNGICPFCDYDLISNIYNLNQCSCGRYSVDDIGVFTVYNAGDTMPAISKGDTFTYGDYIYTYKPDTVMADEDWDGEYWRVEISSKTQTEYGAILESINGQPVTNMCDTFKGCISLITVPTIPNSVTNMSYTFYKCTSLTGNIEINATPTSYYCCFYNTSKEITLSGSSPILAEIAATANNGNVTVAQ